MHCLFYFLEGLSVTNWRKLGAITGLWCLTCCWKFFIVCSTYGYVLLSTVYSFAICYGSYGQNVGKAPFCPCLFEYPQLLNPPIEGVQQRPSIIRSVGGCTVHMLTCTWQPMRRVRMYISEGYWVYSYVLHRPERMQVHMKRWAVTRVTNHPRPKMMNLLLNFKTNGKNISTRSFFPKNS